MSAYETLSQTYETPQDNDVANIDNICTQRRLKMLFNVPPTRFTPESPYKYNSSGQLQFTKHQLDMRRKVEILKHDKSSTKGNKQTKKEQWAHINSRKYSVRKIIGNASLSPGATVVSSVDCSTVPTSSKKTDVPGPDIVLQLDKSVPLYNYGAPIRTYGFLNEKNNNMFENPLWLTSLERIFYIEYYLKDTNINEFVHFDNDVVLFESFEAIKNNSHIIVKIDGDGQMDPLCLDRIIDPIVSKKCDYAKGNRFFFVNDIKSSISIDLVEISRFLITNSFLKKEIKDILVLMLSVFRTSSPLLIFAPKIFTFIFSSNGLSFKFNCFSSRSRFLFTLVNLLFI